MVELLLRPITGETFNLRSASVEEQAGLDVVASGVHVWDGRSEKTFIDVRVFNPFALSNRSSTLAACYNKHNCKKEKRKRYGQQLNMPHLFQWYMLFVTGGASKCALSLIK